MRLPSQRRTTQRTANHKSSTFTRPSSVKVAATGLENMLDELWRMGDQHKCSIEHVNHVLAAIICGHSWHDAVYYNLPIHSKVEHMEGPYTWPEAGTSGGGLGSPWDDDGRPGVSNPRRKFAYESVLHRGRTKTNRLLAHQAGKSVGESGGALLTHGKGGDTSMRHFLLNIVPAI